MNDRTAVQYEIRVRGLLSETLLSAFPEMQARAHGGETVLRGALRDQSALHGVLGQVEAFGLELLEVRRLRARAGASRPGDDRLVHVSPAEPPRQSASGAGREDRGQ